MDEQTSSVEATIDETGTPRVHVAYTLSSSDGAAWIAAGDVDDDTDRVTNDEGDEPEDEGDSEDGEDGDDENDEDENEGTAG